MNKVKEKTALMVDSACDLPSRYIAENNIHIIPINMQYMDTFFKDTRNATQTTSFYKKYIRNKDAKILSKPSSASQIRNQIINDIATEYDNLLIICLSSTRSEIYNNAKEAIKMASLVLRGHYGRAEFRLKKLKAIDTQTLFSGPAVIAYAASEVLKKHPDVSFPALAKYITNLSEHIYTYAVLDDLFYAKHRGKLRGEKSIGAIAYALGSAMNIKPLIQMNNGNTKKIAKHRGFDKTAEKMFNIAEQAIKTGLRVNSIMISYAGSEGHIYIMHGFKSLKQTATTHKVHIHTTIMSTTAGVYVGPGAITLSYCQK